ncbi:ABC transporter ATP-binding protein [Microvirga flavescens]|uniref:ABC transporter ATP-binding protein n=1 Tax=Microvirga flavescens TaxID=2249811 RepID=UPI000DD4EE4E|nr:ABC transporter ATP-binding protein [Microvirga flavescens]
MTHLAARSLAVSLGHKPVLGGIDLAFTPGRLTMVIGPNGAGKTTLLRALAGLVTPEKGAALLDDRPVARMSGPERARAIAYLPQGGAVAWPLSVASVVALGRLPHGEEPDSLPPLGREAVAEAIAAVGLQGFENRPATALSGGERARVLLARALATKAPVLLVDEPIAALDPRHQLRVLEVLRAYAQGGGTVVAITHDLTLAARYADEVVLMDRGAVRAHATPEEVLTRDHMAASFGVEARILNDDGRLVVVTENPLPSAS